ncbi:MAG: hypothetical protein WCP86_05645 [bacterium]|jgi:hypothetical protein
MKPREIVLAWITGIMALFCLTAVVCKPWFDSWRAIRDRAELAQSQIRRESTISSEQKETEKRLQELQKKVSSLPAGEMPNVYLPRLINNLARQNRVPLKDTRIGDEWLLGKLKILPIKYAWGESDTSGIKDLLVAFHESAVIIDVVELTIRSSGQDRLSGSLMVNCVYTK